MKSVVHIGNASGYWGDDPEALLRQVSGGPLDYVTMDFLAEITMVILQRQRARDPKAGFAYDFIEHLKLALPAIAERGVTVIVNAGGINPAGCAEAVQALCRDADVSLPIGVVAGDDLLPRLDALRAAGAGLDHMDGERRYDEIAGRVVAANAYISARPVVEALRGGARIIVTGRTTDAALILAPLVHEFGWAWDDWDRLAAGILVGHLLECSGQSLGGNYSGDWWALPHPWDLPYPIARVDADGTAEIAKPASAGGRVSTDTLRHQLLYEVHDPARYISPDVVADFTSAHFEDLPDDRVRITDVRGTPATPTYTVLFAYHAGWAGEIRVAFSWPDAYEKAKATAAILAKRVEMAGLDVAEWHIEYWGVDALGGPTVPRAADGGPASEPPECVLRVAWRCDDPKTAGLVGRELVPLTLSAPPAGLTGAGGGGGARGGTELLGIWPTLVDKALVDAQVRVTLEEVT